MPIKEIQVTVKEQVAEAGYLIKVSNDLYVEKITFAASQEGFEEVLIDTVPEELRPGYVTPPEEFSLNNIINK